MPDPQQSDRRSEPAPTLTDNGGARSVTFSYDRDNRLTDVTRGDGLTTTFAYYVDGPRREETHRRFQLTYDTRIVYLDFPPAAPALSRTDEKGKVRITDPAGGVHLL